jgi:phage terminase large subunit-like protein
MSYLPSESTLSHMIWRKRYFNEDNTTPIFHYKMLDHYFKDDSYIKPIKAFRGSAKSTNTCYVALHRAEKADAHYTLIISDTTTQAEALVADISDMLRDSQLPYTIVRDVAGEIELLVNSKRYFIVGKGAGSSMRGIKRNRKRPDLIILDDIINDELVMNRLRVDRLNRWFYKALLPSLSPEGEIYAVGTPLSQNDLFMHLCSLHNTLEIPLTDKAWSDRFSPEWIANKKQEYINAGMLREYKQEFELVLTDSDTQLFDMSKVQFIDQDNIPDDLSWFMSCDLAFSEKDSADYSAIVCTGVDTKGNWYIYPTAVRKKPSEVANVIFDLVFRFEVLDVGIEQGSSMIAVQEHLEQLMLDYQQYFNIIELKHGGKSKISRISALQPIVNARRLCIIDNGFDAEMLTEQMELTDSNGCMAKHDDLVDALAYMLQLKPFYSESENYTREDYEDALQTNTNNRWI